MDGGLNGTFRLEIGKAVGCDKAGRNCGVHLLVQSCALLYSIPIDITVVALCISILSCVYSVIILKFGVKDGWANFRKVLFTQLKQSLDTCPQQYCPKPLSEAYKPRKTRSRL